MKYPKNWWKLLKKGDIVKCVGVKKPLSHGNTRCIGKEYTILKDTGEFGFRFGVGLTCCKNHDDFIPIQMATLSSEEEYEIY